MIAIQDPDLPALAELDTGRLAAITGTQSVEILRFRYREGRRAILHVSARQSADGPGQEGAIWFFPGDKGRRIARRNKGAVYDPDTTAVYEVYPQDHRMPEIRTFLNQYDRIAPDLFHGAPDNPPELVRYRPGLSCTLRCRTTEGGEIYVKLISDENVEALYKTNRLMTESLGAGPVHVARSLGIAPELRAIAYEAAKGMPLGAQLLRTRDLTLVRQAIDALRLFWGLPIAPPRVLAPRQLSMRARQSAAFISAICPSLRPALARRLEQIGAALPQVELRPIHGDVTLDHMFADGNRMTLIDTETVSMGPPDYDLAQLHGRLWQAEIDGTLPTDLTQRAVELVEDAAGPAFDWCRGVVAIGLAKLYAQCPGPGTEARAIQILDRLA